MTLYTFSFSPLFLYICIILILNNNIVNSNIVEYKPCPMKTTKEERILHILTCDTKSGYREYNALKCK